LDDRPYKVRRDFRVMTYDVDFAGIMSNQVYQRWLEDLRTDMLSQFADIGELMREGTVPVLAHMEIDFKRPARLMDTVRGEIWVEELMGPRWALRSEFRIGDKVIARAFQWGMFVDTADFRPMDAPPSIPKVPPQGKR